MPRRKTKSFRVFNFSGGRSSALMTRLWYRDGDIVLFADTGMESVGTYKFIDDFEKNEGIKIHRCGYPGGYMAFIKDKGFLPSKQMRVCTSELKIDAAKKYLKKELGVLKFESFIGFRADETRRVKDYDNPSEKVTPVFPLYRAGITKEMVIGFWKEQKYDLEIPSILGNCTLCFLKGKNQIIKIMKMYPELAKDWIEMEEMVEGRTFINGVSYRNLFEISKSISYSEPDLDSLKSEFSCSCSL